MHKPPLLRVGSERLRPSAIRLGGSLALPRFGLSSGRVELTKSMNDDQCPIKNAANPSVIRISFPA